MERECKRCFLYVLEDDGLHLYEGEYNFRNCGWGDVFCDFETDGGKIIDLGTEYDPSMSVMDKRDDESVRLEIAEYLRRSIDDLQRQLTALDNEIILEEKEDRL